MLQENRNTQSRFYGMLYVESGLNESFVYSEVENLTDWTITIQGKIGREKLTEVVPMTITTVSEKRYNFEWTAPTVLENKEYTYTIKSTNIIIDNGILRYGLV